MFAEFSELSAKTIKDKIQTVSVRDYPELIATLSEDPRKSIRQMGERLRKKSEAIQKAQFKTLQMLKMESDLRYRGYLQICGIDEVGRGPLAGPVVAGAVIMPPESAILEVDDSKKLAPAKREALAEQIKKEAVSWAVGVVDHHKIDAINILEATRMAMQEAVDQLSIRPDLLLIDAVRIASDIPVKTVIHGDALCYSIAAASIIAKVHRDNLMQDYHKIYPEYGFDTNMGYGTAKHIEALKKYGPTPIHRRSFIGHFTAP